MNLSVQIESTELCSPGVRASHYTPGDFLVIADTSFYGKLISYGQSLRFETRLIRFNHAAFVINSDGTLVEADGKQVTTSSIGKYDNIEYLIVHTSLSEEDRAEALKFIDGAINERYGWTTIVSCAVSLLTGLKFSFGFDGQEICSGLVARALEHAGFIFTRDASHITPCELAIYFSVRG